MSETFWFRSHWFKLRRSDQVNPDIQWYDATLVKALSWDQQIDAFIARWERNEDEPVPLDRMEYIRRHALQYKAEVAGLKQTWDSVGGNYPIQVDMAIYVVSVELDANRAVEFKMREFDVWELALP